MPKYHQYRFKSTRLAPPTAGSAERHCAMPGGTVPCPALLKPPRGSGLCLRVQPGALPWRSSLPLHRLPSLSSWSSIWGTTGAKQGDQSRQHPSLLPRTGRDAHTRLYLKPPDPPPVPRTRAGQFAQSYAGGAAHLLRHRGAPSAAPSRLQARFTSCPPARPVQENSPAFLDKLERGAGGRTRNSRDRAVRPVFPRARQGKLGSSVPVVLSRNCQPCPCRCGCPCLRGRKGGKMEGEGEGREAPD